MFTDEQRLAAWQQIGQFPLQACDKILTKDLLTQAAVRAGMAVGRGPLNAVTLAYLAVFCALHALRSFADVLTLTVKLLQDADQGHRLAPPGGTASRRKSRKRRSKHDPRTDDPARLSEEAFAQARGRVPTAYWLKLILLLGEKFNRQHGPMLRSGRYRLLAIDGTTLTLDNWRALREHFGTAANGKARRTTQARLVMVSYPLARIPVAYELCPLKRSEKTCAASLLNGLLPDDLVLMDKGFWSYGLFQQVAGQGAYFAIRHFASAKLKTVKRFGKNDALVSYAPSDRKWRHLPEQMLLRRIRYQMPGFRATSLVSNLLDRRVTAAQWVGLSVGEAGLTLDKSLYHHRWGIETSFMEIKVHQKMEQHLRGRTPQTIEYEVAGHLLLYLLLRWLMVEAAVQSGADPLRLSYLAAINELGDIAPLLCLAATGPAAKGLVAKLLARMASHVVPARPGRHYPRPGEMRTKDKGKGHHSRPSKLSKIKA